MTARLLKIETLLTGACVAFSFPILLKSFIATPIFFHLSMASFSTTATATTELYDNDYPGTAVGRMLAIRDRVKSLTTSQLSGDWDEVRRSILWAGGLRDLPSALPGRGYTGHSFNDFNHCDLTAMVDSVSSNQNEGKVQGIHYSNQLGAGIRIASLPELGPGGSWSTCMMGCQVEPPQDVAHLQFRARIAFKLVWAPPSFDSFVLVDDSGDLLAQGSPTGSLPSLRERQRNYQLVRGSKYATVADGLSAAPAKEKVENTH